MTESLEMMKNRENKYRCVRVCDTQPCLAGSAARMSLSLGGGPGFSKRKVKDSEAKAPAEEVR